MAHTGDVEHWLLKLCLERVGHNCRHVVYIAWELVSTVSKTRAWVGKNQMWPLADGSWGDPPSLDSTYYMTSAADGLLINTHPSQIIQKRLCWKSNNLNTTLAALRHIFSWDVWRRQLSLISRFNNFVQSSLFRPEAKTLLIQLNAFEIQLRFLKMLCISFEWRRNDAIHDS